LQLSGAWDDETQMPWPFQQEIRLLFCGYQVELREHGKGIKWFQGSPLNKASSAFKAHH